MVIYENEILLYPNNAVSIGHLVYHHNKEMRLIRYRKMSNLLSYIFLSKKMEFILTKKECYHIYY